MSSNKQIIENLKTKNAIYKSDLKKIKMMKDCTDWNKVVPIARIEYMSDYHHYDGGIIIFTGTPYYITTKQITALQQFVAWKFTSVAKVIEDDKDKKSD
jgi:hypothetical protein